MSKVRTVPWRTPAEQHYLKNALFKPSPELPDLRQAACDKLTAWSTRQTLPHVLNASLLFTSAILLDESRACSTAAVRLSYASAIIRFVNGLLDPLQQGQFANSLVSLAKTAGLPLSFVEVRHACTHEELPSLATLQTTAKRAMDWLWNYYWSKLGPDGLIVPAGFEDCEVVKKRGRDALGQWRRLRRTKLNTEVMLDGELADVVTECETILKGDLDAFCEVLLENKALIPAGQRKIESMKGAVMLWRPLISLLGNSNPGFIAALVTTFVDVLKSFSMAESPDDELQQCVLHWLKEILSRQTSMPFTNDDIANEVDIFSIAKECLYTPTKYTLELFEHIMLQFPQTVDSMILLFQPASQKSQTLRLLLSDEASIARALEEWRKELDAKFESPAIEICSLKRQAEITDVDRPSKSKIRRWEGDWTPKPLGMV
ncbi:Las1-domain-containing protein [Ascobolus immersus RN42]|uniref:Las1-domain-containing protein n=1 Tax=Ascobolus immersus RN42 TaxID=1160509 RepID=A0A3N4I5K6_ASCIM|nr:Las1-domain-containing protein [Ascobolus immersus RN42]